MTSQPEMTVGPWDMKKLLDLLNASEVLGAPEDAPADLLDEHEPRDAAPVPSCLLYTSVVLRAERLELSASFPSDRIYSTSELVTLTG